jgi:hypothetical protein
VAVRFNVANIAALAEIHTHFSAIVRRIPPYACYVHEENHPYYGNTLLEFNLRQSIEIPDTLGEDGGVAGGPIHKGKYSRQSYSGNLLST